MRTLDWGVFDKDYLRRVMERARGNVTMSRLLRFVVNFENRCRLFLWGELPSA
jgi:hypothetical protein